MEEKIIIKKPPKSPFGAGVLSFFFPTTGALYNGQPLKFIIYFIIFAGLITSIVYGDGVVLKSLLLGGFYIFQIFDSVQTAKTINRRALSGKAEEEAPEEDLPKIVKSCSVFWGIFLIILGAIFLLANFEIISYHAIFDLWPLVVIVIGLKLVLDYFSRKRE